MLSLSPAVRVFVAREAADMRKGFDGLEGLAREVIREDPMSGHLFVFFNKRRNRVKVLTWDRTGYLLLYKRLERGTFALCAIEFAGRDSIEMLSSELALLLDGIDLQGAKRLPRYDDKRSLQVHRVVN